LILDENAKIHRETLGQTRSKNAPGKPGAFAVRLT
jgi:hypothetical protein